jgi:predicted glycoside hydrolase/deacetylase ChbG (UPF0249 family)
MLLKDIQFLDDATRPAVPTLPPLDDHQRAAGNHLREIHDHLRANMGTLGGLIERAGKGDVSADEVKVETADLVMVSNFRRFGNLCGQYCQFVNSHHFIEDRALFPAIRAQNPQMKAIADRLEAEHVVVHQLLDRLIEALTTLAEAPDRTRFDQAVEVYRALERVLVSHLGYEEDAIGDALGYYGIM